MKHAPALERAQEAIRTKRVLRILYQGSTRQVEVHAVGLNSRGKIVMRGYQVSGDDLSVSPGWKLFDLSYVKSAALLDVPSLAPRPGYQQGDKGMSTILSEINS